MNWLKEYLYGKLKENRRSRFSEETDNYYNPYLLPILALSLFLLIVFAIEIATSPNPREGLVAVASLLLIAAVILSILFICFYLADKILEIYTIISAYLKNKQE